MSLPPSIPSLRSAPPNGEQWLHEVKFDRWRIQLHKHGDSAAAFTKNGHNHSSRVGWMLEALARLPVRSLIIDGEIVACDDAGVPHYYALHFHSRKYGLAALSIVQILRPRDGRSCTAAKCILLNPRAFRCARRKAVGANVALRMSRPVARGTRSPRESTLLSAP